MQLAINSIIIDPDRQRKELKNIDALAASIATVGLINPIAIKQGNVLMAGERRLTACKQLGWTHIPVVQFEDLSPAQAKLVELEENVKREELPWRDHCAAIEEFHNLQVAENPDWTQARTAEALGLSKSQVSERLAVQEALREGQPLVIKADKYSVARGIVNRAASRRTENERQAVDTLIEQVSPAVTVATPPTAGDEPEVEARESGNSISSLGFTFRNTNFLYESPDGQPVNFIHCDFPYGVKADGHDMGAASSLGGYEDTADIYFTLIDALGKITQSPAVAESCHLMFWFSMDYYQVTFDRLTEMGWKVNPFPLLWFKSDNSGILPDPERGPRRNYETAFIASRGDRKIVQAVSNVYAGPIADKATRIHMSEKPIPMLAHFYRMFVDVTTHMFDPTMGSGNSVIAALEAGAATGLGFEKDEEFFHRAVEKHKKVLID